MVEPRDRATFGGNTLLIIPDMTGVDNPQNRELAGACMSRPMVIHYCNELHHVASILHVEHGPLP